MSIHSFSDTVGGLSYLSLDASKGYSHRYFYLGKHTIYRFKAHKFLFKLFVLFIL